MLQVSTGELCAPVHYTKSSVAKCKSKRADDICWLAKAWYLGTEPLTVSDAQCRQAVIHCNCSTVEIHYVAESRLHFLHLPLNNALYAAATWNTAAQTMTKQHKLWHECFTQNQTQTTV